MVLHIGCFTLVIGSGVALAISTISTAINNTRTTYIVLYFSISLVFLAELPFLYIINRLVSQSLKF
jgi:hypothetical protein